MAQLPEHLKGRTLHIVGPNDDYGEEEDPTQDGDPEYDEMEVPQDQMDKRERLEAKNAAEQPPLRLTKHLKQLREYAPAFTGGAFTVMQG